ncbi:proteasome activator complex subunit 4A-like [Homalodisca vitripennis]|uniref:proteasome activator complex subunit 4A-like n=1 Tax=Homalodisca vitripennis TaxID=197043 RepID=UPI001EEC844E|nr:proteasome activator complex subunit 4A-like [Homalodisca vitripennis]
MCSARGDQPTGVKSSGTVFTDCWITSLLSLSHPYQLLRERIGSVLTNIFALDLPTSGPRRTRGPLISQFVASIMPQLFCLYSLSDVTNSQLQLTSVNVESNTDSQMEVGIPNKFDVDINENGKNTAICLFKTMVKWMTNSIMRADYSSIPEFFAFLPLVCLMENYEADDEVNKVCTAMLAVMAQCLTLPEFLPTALTAINEVAEMSSWSARATCLDFLQVFVFHNMPTISSQEPWVSQHEDLQHTSSLINRSGRRRLRNLLQLPGLQTGN